MNPIKQISPEEARRCIEEGGGLFLDARAPAEHRAIHAVGVKNVPLDTLDASTCNALCAKGGKVYVICKSGQRARMAAEKLVAAGNPEVVVVDGGTDAWATAGLPVVRGQGVMSLERQVRIAAGSLVVVGVVLSFVLHPGFIGLSAFVGCGLVFAGVTDTCMMGMMLSKMPWNQ